MKNQQQHPDIVRTDSQMVLISKWRADDPVNQQAAGDSAIGLWDHIKWPEGLLSHNVYLGTDGSTVLQYSQWTDEEAIGAFTEKHLQDRAKRSMNEVNGLERVEALKYKHYKSMFSDPAGWNRKPGCFIIVSFKTDGPEWQHRFVNTLVETIESRENPHHPGSIASHFHHSRDGKRVVNYAEFVDEASHEEVVQTMLKEDDEIPRLIGDMHGLRPLGFERYTLYSSKKNHHSDK
jgi:heme-degrading monooxygenase HmoA